MKKISLKFIEKNIKLNQSQINENNQIIRLLEDAIKVLGFDIDPLYNSGDIDLVTIAKSEFYETTMLKIGILKNDNKFCTSNIYALENKKNLLLNPNEKEANLRDYYFKQLVLESDNLFFNDFGALAFTDILGDTLKYLLTFPKKLRMEIYDSLFTRYSESCKIASKKEYYRLLHNKNLLLKYFHLVLIEEEDVESAFKMIYTEIINYHQFLQKKHTNEEIIQEKVKTIRKSRSTLF